MTRFRRFVRATRFVRAHSDQLKATDSCQPGRRHGIQNWAAAGCFALLSTAVQADNTLVSLHTFDGQDGNGPTGAVVQGSDGAYYGTSGNQNTCCDRGTVYKIAPDGTFTTLHIFDEDDGSLPVGGLSQGADGDFYGTTEFGGGSADAGTIFKIASDGTFTSLHSFSGPDGQWPYSTLMVGSDGNYYGTTYEGGEFGRGTIFMMSPKGVVTTLHSFGGTQDDGAFPESGIVKGDDGSYYGATPQGGSANAGTIYKLTTNGVYSLVHVFGATDSSGYPLGSLVLGHDGNLYGTTNGLGENNDNGSVFRIAPDGTFTTLHVFNGTDGAGPFLGSLTQGADGSFYGTTRLGGTYGYGTIFSITSAGALTSLYSFDNQVGAYPWSRLTQAADGGLVGTTASGGADNDGGVFSFYVSTSPPTLQLAANPTFAGVGQTVTVFWSSRYTSSCLASGGWSGAKPTTGSETVTIAQSGPNNYALSCTGPGGSTKQSITVAGLPPPSLTLSAHPTQIGLGNTVSVEWQTSGASTCTASGDWSGTEAASGSQSERVSKLGPNNYTLTCSGSTGSATKTVTVTGLQLPTLDFSAQPISQIIEREATLSWSTTNVSSCGASGAWSGGQAAAGSFNVTSAYAVVQNYTLTCDGPGGSVVKTVSISWKLPTVSFATAAERTAKGNLAGESTSVIQVILSAPISYDVTVPFSVGGTDPAMRYSVAPSASVLIPAHSITASITVQVKYPAWLQCDRTIALTMGSPQNATPGAITTNTLTVYNYSPVVACVSVTH